MKTAKFVSEHVSASGALQKVYELSEPLDGHSVVVVSAVNALFSGPETYIFPGNTEGKVTDWGELDGSFRGAKDHARALNNAGYEVVS